MTTAPGRPARVAVVGSANVDLVLDVDHRPAGGETILGSDAVTTPGGKGANQAVAAARAGGSVRFVGCVGDDANGALLRASLADAGVDATALATDPRPTGLAVIVVTPDGENSIVVSPGANRAVTPGLLTSTSDGWADARVLVTQLEIPLETVAELARHSERVGARLVLNAAPAADLPDEVLAVCDPLVVNESEALALLPGHGGRPDGAGAGTGTGADDAGAGAGAGPAAGTGAGEPDGADGADGASLARALLRRGPRSVVVTLGADGAVAADRSGVVRVEAPRVQAVDTTGAGDAFVGALAACLGAGRSLAESAQVAADYAASTVTRRGAQASYLPL